MISTITYNGDGATRIFPVAFEIKGEEYTVVYVGGVAVADKTKYDIINNSIVFNTAPVIGTNNVEIVVASTTTEIADLNAPPSIVQTVLDNMEDINAIATTVVPNIDEILLADDNATIATTKATEASTSAREALASKNLAVISANNALVSEQNADTSEANALIYKNSIEASATTATTQAGIATTKAGEASTSASNALASALSVDSANIVHKTGNETIAGIKTFTSNIVGNITGNAATANALNTANLYIGVGFTANTGALRAQNWNGIATNGVTYYGNANSFIFKNGADWVFNNEQSGYANALSTAGAIVTANGGTWSINSTSSSALVGDETNWASYRSRSVANMLGWKAHGSGHCIFDASASTTPNGVAVNNTNSQVPWDPTYPTLMGWNGGQTYGVRVDSARVADSTTYASAFTTAVGSAPSYACRAWVNFNGTGTVAIRASGNISSITDRGVGLYTANFTTSLPTANYTLSGSASDENSAPSYVYLPAATGSATVSSIWFNVVTNGGSTVDRSTVNIVIS